MGIAVGTTHTEVAVVDNHNTLITYKEGDVLENFPTSIFFSDEGITHLVDMTGRVDSVTLEVLEQLSPPQRGQLLALLREECSWSFDPHMYEPNKTNLMVTFKPYLSELAFSSPTWNRVCVERDHEGVTWYKLCANGRTTRIAADVLYALFVHNTTYNVLEKHTKLQSFCGAANTNFIQLQRFVVTVPNSFDEYARERLRKAVCLAGIAADIVEIQNESPAALMGVLTLCEKHLRVHDKQQWVFTLLLVDVGGYSFDASIVDLELTQEYKRTVTPLAFAGSEHAGEELTYELMKLLKAKLPSDMERSWRGGPDDLEKRLYRAAEDLKVTRLGIAKEDKNSEIAAIRRNRQKTIIVDGVLNRTVELDAPKVMEVLIKHVEKQAAAIDEAGKKLGRGLIFKEVILTGSYFKSYILRELFMEELRKRGKVETGVHYNPQFDGANTLVALGGALTGAESIGLRDVSYQTHEYKLLPSHILDQLPHRVYVRTGDGAGEWGSQAVLSEYTPAGGWDKKASVWNMPVREDPVVLIVMSMETIQRKIVEGKSKKSKGVGAVEEYDSVPIFNYARTFRLSPALLGRPQKPAVRIKFWYRGRLQIGVDFDPLCQHKDCTSLATKEDRQRLLTCESHAMAGATDMPAELRSQHVVHFNSFARRPGTAGLKDMALNFIQRVRPGPRTPPSAASRLEEDKERLKAEVLEVIESYEVELKEDSAKVYEASEEVLNKLCRFAEEKCISLEERRRDVDAPVATPPVEKRKRQPRSATAQKAQRPRKK